MRAIRLSALRLAALSVLACAFFATDAAAQAASAAKGKSAYVKYGCWQCHGFEGQGGIAGPKLAPGPKPLAEISAFVRFTRGIMPPYQEAVLPNADLADIHAYLASIPKGPDYRSIPLLNP